MDRGKGGRNKRVLIEGDFNVRTRSREERIREDNEEGEMKESRISKDRKINEEEKKLCS